MTNRRIAMLPKTADTDDKGRISIGGCTVEDLAATFGTPAFVVDEIELRTVARAYRQAFTSRHGRTRVCFASKAFPATPVLEVVAAESLSCEVAGGGELTIAIAAGFDPAKIVVHGNAKTTQELDAALQSGVGLVVIDNWDDLRRLELLGAVGQPALLRVNPGVWVDTHDSLATGHAASKFGVAFEAAPELLGAMRRSAAVELVGLHTHLGSQLTDLEAYARALRRLAHLGRFDVYDVGGGLGVPYSRNDSAPSIEQFAERVVSAAHDSFGYEIELLVEPGRSLVASSAITLYRVVTVKRQGELVFVAVDGGMADNLEPMLYGTRFEPVANVRGPLQTCELVGRQCESGDVLVHSAQLPALLPDDLVVVPVTGAYCYSQLTNYNGALRPPVVFCSGGVATLRVRRERTQDLIARDVPDPEPVVLAAQAGAEGARPSAQDT